MSNAADISADAFSWGLWLIGGFIVLGTVAWLARRWLISALRQNDEDIWSLQQLREMKTEGRITNEEFEVLKLKVLAASRVVAREKGGATSAGDRRPQQGGDESIKGAADQGR